MKKLIHQMVERQLKVCKCYIQYSIKKINRKVRKSKIAYTNIQNKQNIQNKKRNNGLKVKNDNGPVSLFICFRSTQR